MDYQSPLSKKSSRRALVVSGAVGGIATALGLPMIAQEADARPATYNQKNDAKILNNALYYEHQAIWAYSAAAGKLTNTEVGKAVLALALRNQADHKNHRDALTATITSLGGTPVKTESSYDVSSYIKKGEGNLDSDVNIAKLALALETDAAIAYSQEIAKLKTPKLITIGASIGSTETAHAAAIRATFKSLGVNLEIVPAPFLSIENREAWVLKV
ncbi:ferritin-like domain-containing protein [Nostoc sp.]|uniref:ferritin-like domain-containing protein n=1 Tax=Nostoc sp. TaxID=1180 RepID=UPI002FF748D7